MPRKTTDPRLIALRDKLDKAGGRVAYTGRMMG
jgi:hypothetical protein